jgi:uncharacterized integral membrane protein
MKIQVGEEVGVVACVGVEVVAKARVNKMAYDIIVGIAIIYLLFLVVLWYRQQL